MFRLDAVLIRGNHFRQCPQSSHYSSHLHAFYTFVHLINAMFSYFTAVLMGWVKFGSYTHFGLYLCNYYVKYQIIIYIFYTNYLILCFFSYLAYVDTGGLDCG